MPCFNFALPTEHRISPRYLVASGKWQKDDISSFNIYWIGILWKISPMTLEAVN